MLDKAFKIFRADERLEKHAQYLTEKVTDSVHGLRIKQTRGNSKEVKQVPRFNKDFQKYGLKHTFLEVISCIWQTFEL